MELCGRCEAIETLQVIGVKWRVEIVLISGSCDVVEQFIFIA